MAFEQAFLDELSERNPIEEVVGRYVTLTRRGGNLFGLCPFHSEKTASFSVAPEKGIYYCFGCHKGGGVINFIMEIESLDFPDAVRFLAQRSGMQAPEEPGTVSTYKRQERLWELCRQAARFFRQKLMEPDGEAAREYLARRALSGRTVNRFGLGYAPDGWSSLIDAMGSLGYQKQELLDAGLAIKGQKGGIYDRFRNRLMFPIIDIRGNIIGFGGRVLDDSTPKYLNSPETILFNKRKNLFALNLARKSKQGQIILTEGYMDAIALHQYGFDCAVASLGTSLTEEHANLLAKYTQQIVLIYDGDEAGQNATNRAIPMLEKTGLRVKVLRMQGAKDPDEFLRKFGADRFALLLDQSENQADYRLESLRRRFDLTQDAQRVEFLQQAAELIAAFPNAVQREIYGARAAEAASISQEGMKLEIEKAYRRRRAKEQKKFEAEQLSPARKQQPLIRSLRYDNLRSAMAEEGLLRMLFKEPSQIPDVQLKAEQFSVELFGRIFASLRTRCEQGKAVSLSALATELSAEETAHLSHVLSKEDCLLSDGAMRDYIRIITEEHERACAVSGADLLEMAKRMKETKSYGG